MVNAQDSHEGLTAANVCTLLRLERVLNFVYQVFRCIVSSSDYPDKNFYNADDSEYCNYAGAVVGYTVGARELLDECWIECLSLWMRNIFISIRCVESKKENPNQEVLTFADNQKKLWDSISREDDLNDFPKFIESFDNGKLISYEYLEYITATKPDAKVCKVSLEGRWQYEVYKQGDHDNCTCGLHL